MLKAWQAIKMKRSQEDKYSLASNSEDDLSKNSLLKKEETLYQQRLSLWRRHRNMVAVEVVMQALYTLAFYLVTAKLRSLIPSGPNLIQCKPIVEWHSTLLVTFPY